MRPRPALRVTRTREDQSENAARAPRTGGPALQA